MSAILKALTALLDASYWVENAERAEIWREMVVVARQEYDRLRAEREHEHSERMRLDKLRESLVGEVNALGPYRVESALVRQQLDAWMVPTTVVRPDGSTVHLETWERVRHVIEQRGEASSELARMKARPAEAEFSRLDVMWQELVRERDAAHARAKEIERDTTKAWNEHLQVCSEASVIVEHEGLKRELEVAQAFHNVAVAERNALSHENHRLRGALRKLLLSRDAAWKGGHDWEEALDEALQAYGERP